MSSSNLAKKLQPATKAWKSFANKLKSKLQKPKISKLLKITTHHLNYSLRSIRDLVLRKPRVPTRYHSLGGHRRRRRHYNNHHDQLRQMNFAAIYVDELFAGPASLQMGSTSSTTGSGAGESKAAETIRRVDDEKGLPIRESSSSAGGSSSLSIGDAWKAAVSSLPRVQGIDERAEEFISKFREDIKLQREKSLLDFHDMLARGA